MAVWDPYLSEQDRAVIEASGYGAFLGPGRRPALIVIDVTYSFTGEKREPILDSIRKWHFSCGPKAWDAIPHIQRLLSAARSRNLPIFYSHGYDIRPDGFGKGLWRTTRLTECDPVNGYEPEQFVQEVAPEPRDVVITKTSPSVFFGTPLDAYLNSLECDTVILCGTTTSGCVRATAVDGFARNLRVVVAEEACFDRLDVSHAIALFDLNAKYADVMATDDVIRYVESLDDDLYDGMIARHES